ncbi:Rossmann fold nucleotide-binding protein [Nocardioides anomalus]|uniref:Rossmann fold nucleotide-binding protein n=1 Tax=Nocardioides anomalus TaxID=2712223 RepID=A0A6G6WB43_9ACTN|nr:Rossmann fold nucleotide-binding protein [Nocardioides anomalus]QIG42377.1 Rossmann fold nucleotide-binding protein [Nocardioides anomalus]
MRRSRGRVVQIGSLADFDRRVAAGATRLSGWRVRSVDLSARSEVLAELRVAGATFLGCTFAPGVEERLAAAGALVLPALTIAPVDVYRSALYTPEELYDATPYARSLDARAYAWSQTPGGADDALARSLHDHAVDEALQEWVRGRRLVGVMGGHAAQRGEPGYADAARLGHALGATHVVATGGGPGAMEAANLGCALPADGDLDTALAALAGVPSFRPSVDAWLEPALAVRAGLTDPRPSLAIPTWHYGHEPSNVFATAIAKYFRNAVREAILLEVCDAGIVFLPGAGGTVQEVFQDACENYYADESSIASMVLVGRTYWTETLPAWPLLQALARGRTMESRVHLVDTVADAAALLAQAPAARL